MRSPAQIRNARLLAISEFASLMPHCYNTHELLSLGPPHRLLLIENSGAAPLAFADSWHHSLVLHTFSSLKFLGLSKIPVLTRFLLSRSECPVARWQYLGAKT